MSDKSLIPKLLTVGEAAVLLRTTPGKLAVDRCIGRSNLPYVKLGGRVFYLESDIADYILVRTVFPERINALELGKRDAEYRRIQNMRRRQHIARDPEFLERERKYNREYFQKRYASDREFRERHKRTARKGQNAEGKSVAS